MTSHALLETRYTFETGLSDADAVVRIRIGSWLGEDQEALSTFFEATVLESFKGNIPESFILIQDGCSESTLKGYPLFTDGNELLVYLKRISDTKYGDAYWIIGSFPTVLDVAYDNSGARYYADRYGIMGETAGISNNYSHQTVFRSELELNLIKTDSMFEMMQYTYPYIFAEEDLLPLLRK